VVETTSDTSNASFFNVLLVYNLWRRLDINHWRGSRGRGVLDDGHVHGLSDVNSPLSTAYSAESDTNHKNTAEQEGHAEDEHPEPPPSPRLFVGLECLRGKHASNETDTLRDDIILTINYSFIGSFNELNVRPSVPDAEVLQEESVSHTDVTAGMLSKSHSALLLDITVVLSLLEILERSIFKFNCFLTSFRHEFHEEPRVDRVRLRRSAGTEDVVLAILGTPCFQEGRQDLGVHGLR
jgi:hypothetical protein